MEETKPVLVTGAAGFIGFHLASRLLKEGKKVLGLDSLNDYYDVNLKKSRLALLKKNKQFDFIKMNIADRAGMEDFFKKNRFDFVLHMAAQAGVRYSLTHPHAYIESNLVGFTNILEGCRHGEVQHLIYASSSSVYGANTKIPFSEKDRVDQPISLYAATKRANELMAHTYSHLYALPTTGLRFFTVYGPWGRPDMAFFLFTKAILEGKPIAVFNHGKMRRDFTYVEDVVEAMWRILNKAPRERFQIYNIGNSSPVDLMDCIGCLEERLGKKAEKNFLDLQPGDVAATFSDTSALLEAVGYKPQTSLEEGVGHFVKWYRDYFKSAN